MTSAASLLRRITRPLQRVPQIASIYRHAAQNEMRNPVIVIPGILGSRLVEHSTGKTVWGAFTSEAVDPQTLTAHAPSLCRWRSRLPPPAVTSRALRSILPGRWGSVSFSGRSLREPGDGFVSRCSALGDEREGSDYQPWLRSPIPWTSVTLLADDHMGLTRNPHFINNLLFHLVEQLPDRSPPGFRCGPRAKGLGESVLVSSGCGA